MKKVLFGRENGSQGEGLRGEGECLKKYIKNPYSVHETSLIMGWIKNHQEDPAALAVAMLFTGGLTPQEIAGLRASDRAIWADGREKEEVALAAMGLHQETGEYVFMRNDNNRQKQIFGNGVQYKLYCICTKIDVRYKSIRMDEALLESAL